jgi:CheY-like chemotaxis protein/two-component sensor histidine kinase
MAKLLDDLLDVARITRNRIELDKEKITLQEIVDTAVESTRTSIDQKGHQLDIKLPKQPVWLEVDPTRFTQIIANLIDNAVKFTDRGGAIAIEAAVAGNEVTISVTDSGRGVADEQLEDIFNLFAQTDTTLDRSGGGLGLGLALVKRLVGLHGGTVHAFSPGSGLGSEFRIQLPLAVAPQQAAARTVSSVPRTPYRILVVDDNQDAANALTLLLQMQGHTTHTIYSGIDALAAAQNFAPQVVLLDIGLPQIDGYQVARQLRDAFGRSMKLVAVTGYGQAKDIELAQQVGFDHHLLKPVSLDQLTAVLDRVAA